MSRISVKISCYCLVLLFFITLICHAKPYTFPDSSQNNKNKSPYLHLSFHHPNTDSVYSKEVDIQDFFSIKRKINTHIPKQRKVYVSIFPATGLSPSSSRSIITLGNAAFYLGNVHTTNLSYLTFAAVYSYDNSFAVPFRLAVWSKDNQFYFVGDWRYLHYPENTYGLGGGTTPQDKTLIKYSYIRFYQTALCRITKDWYYGLGYQLDYHFNLDVLRNPPNDRNVAQEILPSVSSGISMNILSDNRRNAINPLKGHYFTAIYRWNNQFLGSTGNWQSLYVDARKYFRVGNQKNVLAFCGLGWFTFSGIPPYLDMPAIGWDLYSRTGRGYSQGRFRANEMIYAESEFRFKITHNGLLGGVVFVNASTYSQPVTRNFVYILPAAGTGLRVNINKHSRTNLAIDAGMGMYNQFNIWINIGEIF